MKTAEAPIEIPSHFIRRPDGTRLRYFDTGEDDRPALVLANGLGGPLAAFHPHMPGFGAAFRLLSWDYRGTYGSTLGNRDVPLGVPAHAQDLAAILDHAQVKRATFLGWSMGVQVGLELYGLQPHRFDGLVFMNGTFGRPLGSVALPLPPAMLPLLVQGARRIHWLGRPLVRGVRRVPAAPRILRRVGFVARTFDDVLLSRVLEDFQTLDFDVYFDLLGQLGDHDGTPIVERVDVPTLIITGSRDFLTPPPVARRMAERVRGAELHVIEGGSHYAAAEFPQEVVERVLRFLKSRVLAPARAS